MNPFIFPIMDEFKDAAWMRVLAAKTSGDFVDYDSVCSHEKELDEGDIILDEPEEVIEELPEPTKNPCREIIAEPFIFDRDFAKSFTKNWLETWFGPVAVEAPLPCLGSDLPKYLFNTTEPFKPYSFTENRIEIRDEFLENSYWRR